MTVPSLFYDEQHTVMISCSHCGRTKRVQRARFQHLHRPLRVKCTCGLTFMVTLDAKPQNLVAPDEGSVTGLKAQVSEADRQRIAGRVEGEAAETHTHQLTFQGSSWDLFRLYTCNRLMTSLTLGFYQCWGRTKIREYLWKKTELEGFPFAYSGNGKEVLLGWLKLMIAVGFPLGVLQMLPHLMGSNDVLQGLSVIVAYGLTIVATTIVMLHLYRYRLSRTSWRGRQFSFQGRVVDFLKLHVVGILLTAVTLGLYYPIFTTKRYAFLTSHSYYGKHRFRFHGHGRELCRSFLLSYLLVLPTLGLSWFWFSAARQRYFWNNTALASVQFSTQITGRELLLLKLGNLALLIASLGLGSAWVKIRNLRFAVDHLTLIGPLHVSEPPQAAYAVVSPSDEPSRFLAWLETDFNLG